MVTSSSVDAGAFLIGGNDTIIKTDNGIVYGDTGNVSGTLIGGADTIVSSGSSSIAGDTFNIGSGGAVYGGDDVLIRQSGGTVYGDAIFIEANEGLIGGNDRITGSNFNDTLYGDVVSIGSTASFFVGGNDTIFGGAGTDTLYGDFSSNFLASGVGGNDGLFGGSGNDSLYGGGGDDYLDGGSGTETRLDGGAGNDAISFLSATSAASVALYLGSNQVINDGYGNSETLISIEWVVGSYFGDTIVADEKDNVLQGGFGDDAIYAGFGNDYIVGGIGNDLLNGDEGYDTFAFSASEFSSGVFDRITDFSETGTSFDSISMSGFNPANVTLSDFGGDAYIFTSASFDSGIVIENFTVAQLSDQFFYV